MRRKLVIGSHPMFLVLSNIIHSLVKQHYHSIISSSLGCKPLFSAQIMNYLYIVLHYMRFYVHAHLSTASILIRAIYVKMLFFRLIRAV